MQAESCLHMRLLEHHGSYGFDELSRGQRNLRQAPLYQDETPSVREEMNGCQIDMRRVDESVNGRCIAGIRRGAKRPVGVRVATSGVHRQKETSLRVKRFLRL